MFLSGRRLWFYCNDHINHAGLGGISTKVTVAYSVKLKGLKVIWEMDGAEHSVTCSLLAWKWLVKPFIENTVLGCEVVLTIFSDTHEQGYMSLESEFEWLLFEIELLKLNNSIKNQI